MQLFEMPANPAGRVRIRRILLVKGNPYIIATVDITFDALDIDGFTVVFENRQFKVRTPQVRYGQANRYKSVMNFRNLEDEQLVERAIMDVLKRKLR